MGLGAWPLCWACLSRGWGAETSGEQGGVLGGCHAVIEAWWGLTHWKSPGTEEQIWPSGIWVGGLGNAVSFL